MTGLGAPFKNSHRPAPVWDPHREPCHPDRPFRPERDECSAATCASVGPRPVLIVGVMTASLLSSSFVGIENGFGPSWLVINAGLQLSIVVWLLIRPGCATAGALSAGVLTAFVLVVYGSWAPALAAGEPFSPLVPSPVEKSALEYTTAAALIVTIGVVLTSFLYAATRASGTRPNRHRAVPPHQWWRGVLLMEAIGLCCFVAFMVSSHQPIIALSIFRPLPAGIAQEDTASIYQFLGAGIDVSIGAGIAASGLLGLKAYRFRVLALIALNLFLYSTIGFKYRIVVTLIGAFGVWTTTRPNERRLAPRSQRMKAVLAGVVVIATAFFVVQVFRGNHENSQNVTASSFGFTQLERITTNSIDIATPYAAIHQRHFGLLLGQSYLQLPQLFVPQVIVGHKPLPAMVTTIRDVIVPGTGAAVPLWAEADANFGPVGLLGFGVILGWIVARSDTADRRHMETAAMAAAAGAVLASVLSRSTMFFALYAFAAVVLPIWMLSRWGLKHENQWGPLRRGSRLR